MNKKKLTNETFAKLALIEKGKLYHKAYIMLAPCIVVRPFMNNFTGGFLSSAIFERILYYNGKYEEWWAFTMPCEHKDYKKGKSLCEIFNITKFQLNTALKRFAFKLGKTRNIIKKEDALVLYYRKGNSKTYYKVNWDMYFRLMGQLSEKVEREYEKAKLQDVT